MADYPGRDRCLVEIEGEIRKVEAFGNGKVVIFIEDHKMVDYSGFEQKPKERLKKYWLKGLTEKHQ